MVWMSFKSETPFVRCNHGMAVVPQTYEASLRITKEAHFDDADRGQAGGKSEGILHMQAKIPPTWFSFFLLLYISSSLVRHHKTAFSRSNLAMAGWPIFTSSLSSSFHLCRGDDGELIEVDVCRYILVNFTCIAH